MGGARPPTAFTRIESLLQRIIAWATEFGLKFSPTKSQLMSVKGGLKATYTIGFGTSENAQKIEANNKVKYLGVMLDPRRSFWNHVESLKNKSTDLYTRLRRMTSANWCMGREAAKIIYEAVFLPRVTYAAEIWDVACLLRKSVVTLGSMKRAPLLAITSCYRTASTNCLTAVAGVLPLDLEIRKVALKCRFKNGDINYNKLIGKINELTEE